MDSLTVLDKATRPGWKTSEFWVSLAGMAAALFLPQADKAAAAATDAISKHGSAGAIAAGAIAGAYAVGRSIVKATTAKALLTPVAPPVSVEEIPSIRPADSPK